MQSQWGQTLSSHVFVTLHAGSVGNSTVRDSEIGGLHCKFTFSSFFLFAVYQVLVFQFKRRSLESCLLPQIRLFFKRRGHTRLFSTTTTTTTTITTPPAQMSKDNSVDPDHELISALQKLSKKSPKLVRSSTYPAPAEPNVIVRSWKMNEFKYYDVPSPFPTLARGLFTRWIAEAEGPEDTPGAGRHAIVARGYDKFFNIGEVPWTNVRDRSGIFDFILAFSNVNCPQVGSFGKTYRATVRPYPQIKWMHHLHCRSHSNQAHRHLKAFYWSH